MNISINYFKTLSSLYHSSSVNYAALHKTFRKVLGAGTTKKNFKYQGIPKLTNVTDLTKSSNEGKRHSLSKRASMLNKMFMRYITDLIVNGNYWEEYVQNGIEINRIEVSPDYMRVNIFWITKEKNRDEAIQSFLSENAYTLRHELSQLRVMGVVPPLSFIKDKHQSELLDLDHRISIADYGIDYEPSSVSRMKHQLELYSSIDDKLKSKLENLENDEEEEEVDVDLPEMPQNIYGLDYVEILNRVNKLSKSLVSSQQNFSNEGIVNKYTKDVENLSPRDAFRLFLQKRQIAMKKINKEDKNQNIDMKYIKQEILENSHFDHYKNIEDNLDRFDEDFIDDETEEKEF